MRKPRFGLVVATAGSASVIALYLTGAARAVTDTIFRYSTPKTGYYTIDPLAMAPVTFLATSADAYVIDAIGLFNAGSYYQCFSTGVNLPNGATITRIAAWLRSSTNGNPNVYLHRKALLDGTNERVASQVLNDDTAQRKSVGANAVSSVARVNNGRYSYAFGVCLWPGYNDVFFGARITYTYDHAGD
jgi:hypothetical protein